ncbi:DgyrCDS3060 [Dimorphilus gyrociliatus]|uniref:DgyrCDS3060 n=1 Tax=Dimorphilus gyrociliatus TaxID=2664684 RepID=A0A7I8VF39_9ANNE|nr:DgyrCDS3060 [Dimorphilus gyrociliatus]
MNSSSANDTNIAVNLETDVLGGRREKSQSAAEYHVEKLQRLVNENNRNYDAVSELMEIYQSKNSPLLQEFLQNVSKNFALTEDVWYDLLQNEMQILDDNYGDTEKVLKIDQLMKRATDDHCAFRNLYERAYYWCGSDVCFGHIIWNICHDIEKQYFCYIQANDDISEDEKEKLYGSIADAKADLYRNQCQCPVSGVDVALAATKELGEDLVDQEFESFAAEAIAAHENRLTMLPDFAERAEDKEILAELHKKYIQFELEGDEKMWILNAFNRALLQCPYEKEIWTDYLIWYSENVVNDLEQILRALRFLPKSCRLSAFYLLKLEESETCSEDTLINYYEEYLSMPFDDIREYGNLWIQYINFHRRMPDLDLASEENERKEYLRDTLERAVMALKKNMRSADPKLSILRQQADIEARLLNMPRAREIWGEVMNLGGHQPTLADSYIEYIKFESAWGDTKHVLKLVKKAISKTPANISKIRLYDVALEIYNTQGSLKNLLSEVFEIEKARNETQKEINANREKTKVTKTTKEKTSQKDRKKQQTTKSEETADSTKAHEFKMPAPFSEAKAKKKTFVKETTDASDDTVSSKKRKLSEEESGDEPTPPKIQRINLEEDVSDKLTAFVSNLEYSVTEERIQDIFEAVGKVKQVRLAKTNKNTSRGFAYVDFADEVKSYEAALSIDRTLIDGRPMYVSKLKKKGDETKVFKFSTNMEKNKLFVRNIPLDVPENELQNLFEKHGKIKSVRLVTYRNGKSKGIAYIEFEKDSEATDAVMKLDNFEFKGQTLSVAISNPPPRNQPVKKTLSLGSGKKETNNRGKAHTQLSFLPTSLRKKQDVEKVSTDSSKPMTNDEFRNFLTKK